MSNGFYWGNSRELMERNPVQKKNSLELIELSSINKVSSVKVSSCSNIETISGDPYQNSRENS